MTINPLATELATEHRRTLLHEADTRRLARAVRRTRTRRVSPLTVRIRPVRPADASLLVDVLARLSPESRLARFLYPKTTLSDAELR